MKKTMLHEPKLKRFLFFVTCNILFVTTFLRKNLTKKHYLFYLMLWRAGNITSTKLFD